MTVLMNKKEEIKNRIDLINHGEIPDDYKCCWGYIYPESWDIKSLKDLFYKVKTKNTANESLPVLTNSATLGVILQDEYFDREIVNDENTDNYYIVENGDFMYNPRISSNAPAGPINRNTLGQKGIASPLYTIFRAKDTKNIEFVEKYLKSNYWHKYMKSVSNQGARHDRLNISDEDFMRMPIPQPPKKEQEKIAKILNCCDEVIELKQKLLEEISKEKSILMAKVFKSPQKMIKLSKLANVIMGQSPNSQNYNNENLGMPLIQGNADCENRFTKPRLWTTEITKQCQIGDIIMSVRAPAGTVSISRHNACIGRGVCSIRAKSYTDILYQYLIYIEPKWKRFVQGSTFEAINSSDINNLLVPIIGEKEQEKISNVFNLIDKKIELLSYELEQHKQLKKALSQLLLTGIVRTVEVDCEN